MQTPCSPGSAGSGFRWASSRAPIPQDSHPPSPWLPFPMGVFRGRAPPQPYPHQQGFWGPTCCCRCSAAKSLQLSSSLWDPIDGSPPGSPVPGILQAKNTGVGCHFLLQCMKVKRESEVAQSCPTLHDPMDCSLPGSSVHGIFQVRVLEWVVIAPPESNRNPRSLPAVDGWTLPGQGFSPSVSLCGLGLCGSQTQKLPHLRRLEPIFLTRVSSEFHHVSFKQRWWEAPQEGPDVTISGLSSGAKPGFQREGELAGWVARVQACQVHFWSVLAGPRWADPLWVETSLPNLTKRKGLLREGAGTVGMRMNMVDLEILQVGQAWLVEGFGGAGTPVMLQIPS